MSDFSKTAPQNITKISSNSQSPTKKNMHLFKFRVKKNNPVSSNMKIEGDILKMGEMNRSSYRHYINPNLR